MGLLDSVRNGIFPNQKGRKAPDCPDTFAAAKVQPWGPDNLEQFPNI